MKTTLLVLALAGLGSVAGSVGCSTSEATPSDDVSVELAAVTLGDQCGGVMSVPPPASPPAPSTPITTPAKSALKPAEPGAMAADCASPGCGRGRGCDQTSMQLALKTKAGVKATQIRIKKVELLDPKGKLLEVLTASDPSRWDSKAYVPWDQAIGASQTLQTSYVLSSPNWDKLTGSRWEAHTKKFQLRVTVTVGTADRKVEKTSIVPAMLPPPVPT